MSNLPDIILRNKSKIKFAMSLCARCSMCAPSCFLYRANNGDPTYMPSYKMLNSIGIIFKKKGDLSDNEIENIKNIVWEKCVLCTRCYCSLGIDIPYLISIARDFCRQKGVYKTYDN
ncbi:hypothetical protein JCM12298_02440 [Desulfothermus naphthae]